MSNVINPFKRLQQQLLPSDPLRKGAIQVVHADGTATVALAGGAGSLRVRNPLAMAEGANVFIQGGAITGEAPALPVVMLEI